MSDVPGKAAKRASSGRRPAMKGADDPHQQTAQQPMAQQQMSQSQFADPAPTVETPAKAARDARAIARVWLAQVADRLRALDRNRPSRRVAISLIALPALLGIACYALMALALDDMVRPASAAPSPTTATDLTIRDGAFHLASAAGSRIATDDGSATVQHRLSPSANDAVDLRLTGRGEATVVTDTRGRVTLTTLGDRSRPHEWFENLGSHWRQVIWRPYLAPWAASVLDRVIQDVPISVPASARPQRLGTFSDCGDCPEMTIVSRGFSLLGPDPQTTDPTGRRWRIAQTDAVFAVSTSPVSEAQWKACIEAGACPPMRGNSASPTAVESYLAWLRKRTQRNYRMVSGREWEALARTASPGMEVAGVASTLPNYDPLRLEWTCDGGTGEAAPLCKRVWLRAASLLSGYRLIKGFGASRTGNDTALVRLALDQPSPVIANRGDNVARQNRSR